MKRTLLLSTLLVAGFSGVFSQTPETKSIQAYPGYVRVTMLQGEMAAGGNTIYSNDATPLVVTKVVSPVPWMTATVRKAEPSERIPTADPNNAQYRVDIKIDSTAAKLGPIAEKVRVITNSATQPEVQITISGVIRPPFRVEPTAINFGEVAPNDTAATRTVMLRSNDLRNPRDFAVTKVEHAAERFLEVTFKPTDRAGEFEITLQIRRNARPESFENVVVRIHTNSRIRPVVDLPIKGTIKAMS